MCGVYYTDRHWYKIISQYGSGTDICIAHRLYCIGIVFKLLAIYSANECSLHMIILSNADMTIVHIVARANEESRLKDILTLLFSSLRIIHNTKKHPC